MKSLLQGSIKQCESILIPFVAVHRYNNQTCLLSVLGICLKTAAEGANSGPSCLPVYALIVSPHEMEMCHRCDVQQQWLAARNVQMCCQAVFIYSYTYIYLYFFLKKEVSSVCTSTTDGDVKECNTVFWVVATLEEDADDVTLYFVPVQSFNASCFTMDCNNLIVGPRALWAARPLLILLLFPYSRHPVRLLLGCPLKCCCMVIERQINSEISHVYRIIKVFNVFDTATFFKTGLYPVSRYCAWVMCWQPTKQTVN